MQKHASVDGFGVPLLESEIEVPFTHEGKPAYALFEVESWGRSLPGSREFPPEHPPVKAELIAIAYDDETPIYQKEVFNLKELKDQAIEIYHSKNS
jgi:hypothetical protein